METIICKQLDEIMKAIQDVEVKFDKEIKIIKKKQTEIKVDIKTQDANHKPHR